MSGDSKALVLAGKETAFADAQLAVEQDRFQTGMTYIVQRWADWKQLRRDLAATLTRCANARRSILTAYGMTEATARTNPARLGADRDRYDTYGKLNVEVQADQAKWDSTTATIQAALLQIPNGYPIPAELWTVSGDDEMGASPLIPLGVGAAILLAGAAMYLVFRSQGIRIQQLAALDQQRASGSAVLAMQAAGRLTPEQAIAELQRLNELGDPTKGSNLPGTEWLGKAMAYAPYLLAMVVALKVLPSVLQAVRPHTDHERD